MAARVGVPAEAGEMSRSVSTTAVLETEPSPPPSRRSSSSSSSSSTRPASPPSASLPASPPSASRETSPLLRHRTSSPSLSSPFLNNTSPFLNNTSPRRFWFIFSQILTTQFIACFDGTIMASSHPVITSYFGAANSASWLSTAFLLTSTAFQPLLGRLSDAVGRKPLFVGCLAVFAVATGACAGAQSIEGFIAARALCGLGAGGAMTLGSIITSDLVPIERRGVYQSYVNVVYGLGSTLGAALGGAMAETLGWRWEFGVQIPPLLLCLGLAAVALPARLGVVCEEGEREGGRQGGEGEGEARHKATTVWRALRAFDARGSMLLTLAICFLILGLNLGGNVLAWSHPLVVASLAVFAVCFPALIWVEARVPKPIMPLHLLRESPLANLIFANFIAALISHAIFFNIPLYFQAVLLTSATSSGLRLMLPSLVASLAGACTGFAITRTRRLKWPLVSGTCAYLAGTLCLALLRRRLPAAVYLAALMPAALGQGFQFPGTFVALLACSSQRDQAVVTSTLVLWRSLGMVLGVAASSLVVQNALVVYLDRYVHGPQKDEVVARVRASVQAIGALHQPYREQVVQSYEAALRLVFVCCAVAAAVSVAIIWPIKLPRLGGRKRHG